jgi:hypothetical protein
VSVTTEGCTKLVLHSTSFLGVWGRLLSGI